MVTRVSRWGQRRLHGDVGVHVRAHHVDKTRPGKGTGEAGAVGFSCDKTKRVEGHPSQGGWEEQVGARRRCRRILRGLSNQERRRGFRGEAGPTGLKGGRKRGQAQERRGNFKPKFKFEI